MAPELMRRRIIKRSMRIIRPPQALPPAVTAVATKELERLLDAIDCFLVSEPGVKYSEGYILLRQEIEEKLRDVRFRGYGWHIKKHQVVFDDNLRALADRACVDIQAVLRFRST